VRAEREMRRRGLLLAEARAELDNVIAGAKLGSLSGTDVGPYRVEEVIGRGGMGEVYRAVDRGTGEACALKVLHAAALEDATSVERFFREAEVSSSLDSAHIVRVHATGTTPEGLPYIAMELLTGCDLARLLQQHGSLSPAECAKLVSDLARALGAARRAGIVHRDIKPQNVFRAEKPERTLWKLLDFGVTKLLDGSSRTLTRGAAVGTPAYMSPEQVRGLAVDHRSDVFSLGVVAYRAVTGQPAFTGPDHLAIMYQVYHQQPQQPSSLVALHPDVDLVFAIVLAKDRDARFQTAEAFATALADAVEGRLAAPLRSRGEALVGERPWRNVGADDLTVSETGAGAAIG
jgi:serine/threonine-protein kinase